MYIKFTFCFFLLFLRQKKSCVALYLSVLVSSGDSENGIKCLCCIQDNGGIVKIREHWSKQVPVNSDVHCEVRSEP